MIRGGYLSILMQYGILSIFLFVIALRSWRQSGYKFKSIWNFLPVSCIVILVCYIHIMSYINRSYLRTINANSIASIEIKERKFTKPSEIKQMTDSFSSLEAWVSNHAPSPTIPFIIKLKSGVSHEYRIMYWESDLYQNGENINGIVIDFYKQFESGRFNQGGAFSEEMQTVLHTLSVDLDD